MIRIEIIANHSVEENILEAFALENVGKYYTRYPNVMGVGRSGPKMGDAIWPEENFVLVVWCEEDEARGIERAVAQVKERFPGEGIKLFGLRSADSQPREALPAPAEEAPPPEPEGAEGLAGLAGLE
ncbi:PG0541 family transporter-associated protein [Treponema primitia]|uniref:PG0541 family transporter-associated protein n=1 Tax=Treponema primitia TaxID=88058 RepID=UPI00025555C6|nr:PG0541 family transporter-associated protein [Treponema primitia]